ncbi:MAG TPA: hypothetical protein VF544_17575 [Pyrinomonadaceae bacterium]|jgi:hypothetical protein
MAINSRIALRSSFVLALLMALFVLTATAANAQAVTTEQTAKTEAVNATTTTATAETAKTDAVPASQPVFKDYRGISIGMTADEVRDKLGNLKEKGKVQDFFVFSEEESAQVYYDNEGKVMAISVNYLGADSKAPKPAQVVGEEIQAKQDGSMYELKRYPEAGYWVAYSRTAGDSPLVTITMQKMP